LTNIATVTSKGRVTVPIEVRNRLGLKEGDRLAFVSEGGEILLRLDRGEKNPFSKYAGALKSFSGNAKARKAWFSDLRDDV
jgi:antitoxin PrlF